VWEENTVVSEICSAERSTVQYFAQVVPGVKNQKAWLPVAPLELIELVFYKSHSEKRSDKEIYLERLTPCESSPLFKKKDRF
jgi:hypothetical protein